MAKTPASIRANNPGNIKTGVGWLGVIGTTGVSAGVNDVFATPVYGARALAKNIIAKFDGRASDTSSLLNILSPSSENNTQGYVIPTVVSYMNANGYPDFNEFTSINDKFGYDRDFSVTYMEAIANMEQAGSLEYFTRDVMETGYDARLYNSEAAMLANGIDPNKFGDGSDAGFQGGGDQGGGQTSSDTNTQALQDAQALAAAQRSGASGTSGAPGTGAVGGGSGIGFKDPDKVFYVDEYKSRQTTNEAARGEWKPKLKLPQGNPFEVPQDAQPEYPHNKVIESTNPNTEERHRIELDDTPSGPRVTIVHKNGSGLEMLEKDGLFVINSSGKMVQLVGADFCMFVNGNGDVRYQGNLNLTVEGDMNLKVKGNMTTYVEGNKTEIVEGDTVKEVWGDDEKTVTGNNSETVAKTSTELVLGNKNSFVKGQQSNWVKGDAEFLSGATTHISAQESVTMAATDNIQAASGKVFSATSTVTNLDGALSLDISSPTMTVNANNLDIFSATTLDISTATGNWHAAAGTLGGPGVYHYGAAWDGTLNVIGGINAEGNVVLDQTLEVGGNAELGGTLDVGEIVSSGDITAFGSVTAPASTSITDASGTYLEPTSLNIGTTLSPLATTLAAVATTLTSTLTASEAGIMQVSIDPGDKLLQQIDLRERLSLANNTGPQR